MIGKRISSAPHCHVSAVSLIRFVDYDGNTYDRHKRRQYKQEPFSHDFFMAVPPVPLSFSFSRPPPQGVAGM